MPLLIPFPSYFVFLNNSAAADIYTATRRRTSLRSERSLTATWVALYLWLMVNSTVARLTHINRRALLLSAIATLLATRAARPQAAVTTTTNQFTPEPLAAAALLWESLTRL